MTTYLVSVRHFPPHTVTARNGWDAIRTVAPLPSDLTGIRVGDTFRIMARNVPIEIARAVPVPAHSE